MGAQQSSSETIIEQVESLRLLFKYPLEYFRKLIQIYPREIVDNYLKYLGDKCNRIEIFFADKTVGSGAYGTAIRYCIDPTCKLSFVMKIAYINEKDIDIKKPDLPENIEVEVLERLNVLFKKLSDNKKSPYHVTKIYDSFKCVNDYQLSPIFYNLIQLLKQNMENKEQFSYRWYSVILVEWVDLGSLVSNINTDYINSLAPLAKLKEYKSVIFQAIMILALIQDEWPSFRHNDYHIGNLLLAKNYGNLEYTFQGSKYLITNPICKVLINDFDFATSNELRNRKFRRLFPSCKNLQSPYRDVYKFINSLSLRSNIPNEFKTFADEVVPQFIRGIKLTWAQTNLTNDEFYSARTRMNLPYGDPVVVNYGTLHECDENLSNIFAYYGFDPNNYVPNKLIKHTFFSEFNMDIERHESHESPTYFEL